MLEQDDWIGFRGTGDFHALFGAIFADKEFITGQLAIPYKRRCLYIPLSDCAVPLHCDKPIGGVVLDGDGFAGQDRELFGAECR